jgi:hypothetical protein
MHDRSPSLSPGVSARVGDPIDAPVARASQRRRRVAAISNLLFGISVVFAVWSLVLWATGGFVFDIATIHIASRRPRNPAVVALVCALLSIRAWPDLWRRSAETRRLLLQQAERALHILSLLIARSSPGLAVAAALGVAIAAMTRGAFIAGGSDSYGYVSQAHLWRSWDFFLRQPLAHEMTWPFTGRILAPLGYLPSPTHPDASVPSYSPGLPMMMALFGLIGGDQAMFYVVPALAGVAVAATYVIGQRLGGRAVGAWAAVLLATSPAFLFQAMFPMSDLPAAAWWTLSLAAMPFGSLGAAAVSGLAAGAAILTRPNLVPLAIVPGCWFLRRAWAGRDYRSLVRLFVFGSGVVLACTAVGGVNAMWYGSPLQSGYGPLREYYDLGYVWLNIKQYSEWLVRSQTLFIAIALLVPASVFMARGWRGADGRREARAYAISLLCFVGAVALSYLFYTPYDAWWYLRFLLPAFPALFVLLALTLGSLVQFLPESLRVPLATAAIALVAWRTLTFAERQGVWLFREGERKYAVVGDYVSRRLPEEAVVLAVQHSGSIRYYSGRQTVRFDWIPPPAFDAVVENFVRHGHRPYLVLEKFEEPSFRELFAPHTALGQLRWNPLARTADGSAIAIYDLVDRENVLEPDVIR